MSAIVISQKENETYKFTFEHRRGRTLLTSQEHTTKDDVYKTIDFLKEHFASVESIRFKTPSGKFYFKIVIEGNTYGTSRRFNTELRFENGIEEVVTNFVSAETLDLSLDIFGDFPED
ncbi:hypothetical protein ACPDHL_10925 [Myroides sp. C15-4]|uniref:hypothetical protein n=1 Tax=Myroides sp. C15-4 TaxID=3400532 RepID=UPI003D2F970A